MQEFDKETVEALVEWAKSTDFPKELVLSECETIKDVPKFVQSCVSDITFHYPDAFYSPSIVRLCRLREALEKGGGE